MSNIANQIVAVAATLLGFIAHDLLAESDPAARSVANASLSVAADPVVTRSVDIDGLSQDWLAESPRAERELPSAPSIRFSGRTAAAMPHPVRAARDMIAGVRINDASFADFGQRADTAPLR
ncbi:MAG: hypothetical protein KDJ87_01365 [Rhizobiaceae bacterium]|nr:hypothetical protein [Rhizobiaceae bacterium]